MKKLLYLVTCLIIVCAASSCSKQCVQCQATDKFGVVINQSNVICDGNANRTSFEDRYKTNFQGFTVTCTNHD